MYLSFYCNVCVWEGAGEQTKTAIYWPPLLWPSALCLSHSPGLLNQRPGGSAFCWVLAFSTTSCHQRVSKTTGGLEGPFGRVWLSLPHLISNFSGPQLTDFLSSQSYIIVQRPLNRPHNLWNGMFDRDQAEITVMQFRGHSLLVHQSMSVSWCNCYRRRNWTRRLEFKSWTRLIAFHIALIPLGKVWIQLFSLQLWVNSRTD